MTVKSEELACSAYCISPSLSITLHIYQPNSPHPGHILPSVFHLKTAKGSLHSITLSFLNQLMEVGQYENLSQGWVHSPVQTTQPNTTSPLVLGKSSPNSVRYLLHSSLLHSLQVGQMFHWPKKPWPGSFQWMNSNVHSHTRCFNSKQPLQSRAYKITTKEIVQQYKVPQQPIRKWQSPNSITNLNLMTLCLWLILGEKAHHQEEIN